MITRKLKRCLAGIMAVATVLSSSNIAYAAESLSNTNGSWSTTAAKIVASEYYGSESEEAKILSSNIIKQGKSYDNIAVPTDDEELVVIDSDAKVVYAEAYEGWIPVSAVVTDAEDSTKTTNVTFTDEDEDGTYVSGKYDDTYVSCTADVTYQLDMSFDETARDEMAELSKIPGILYEAMEYYDTLGETASSLESVDELLQEYYQDPIGTDLCALFDKNTQYDNVFAYLIDKGDEIVGAAEALYDKAEDYSSYLGDVIDSLSFLAAGCELAKAPEKVFAGTNYGDSSLEDLAEDVEDLDGVSSVEDTITIATTVLTAKADVVTVTVNVKAVVASDEVYTNLSSVEAKTLTYTESFVLPKVAEGEDDKLDLAIGQIQGKAQNEISENAFESSDEWKASDLSDEEIRESLYTYTEDSLNLTSISEDLTFNVCYTVKNHKVETNFAGTNEKVPYGTQLKLPEHSDALKDYDYVALSAGESTYYNEGKVITIKKDLEITQTEASQKRTESLLSLLSKDTQYNGLDTVKDILTSKAVKSASVTIRQPENTSISDIVTDGEGNYAATAGTIESGVAGMVWVPVSARVMNEEEVVVDNLSPVQVTTDAVNTTVSQFSWSTAEDFTDLEVQYALDVTSKNEDNEFVSWGDNEILDALNLSKKLVTEVQEQNNTLQKIKTKVYDEIQKDKNLQIVMSKIGLEALQKDLSANGKTAIQNILKNGVTGSELTLYHYLKLCDEAGWELSAYYANGYDKVLKAQAELLVKELNVVADDSNLGTALNKFGTYSDSEVESIRKQIKDFTAELTVKEGEKSKFEGPNEVFDMSDMVTFDTLIDAIIAMDASKVPTFSESKGLKVYSTVTKDAPKYGSYTVVVEDAKGNTLSGKIIFEKDETETTREVTAEDIEKINDKIAELSETLGITEVKYFTTSDTIPASGATVAASSTVNYVYAARTYTANVSGIESTITFNGTETAAITLPAPTEEDCYYTYTIVDGTNESETLKVRKDAAVTYTVKSMSDLADGKDVLSIECEKIDTKTEAIDTFVNALNDAMKKESGLKDEAGNLMAAFVPVKSYTNGAANGKYESIVLRMDYSSVQAADGLLNAIGNAMMDIAMTTPYIGFNDSQQKFLYSVEGEGTYVDIQAMIDLFLTSGLGLDDLNDIIGEDGSIKDTLKLEKGTVAEKSGLIAESAGLGGVLVNSNIQLGSSAEEGDYQNVPFYITLAGKQSEYLKGIKNFVELTEGYVNVEFADGEISLYANMPENAYTIYLSAMLMLGILDVKDINQDIAEHVNGLKEALLAGIEKASYITVQNTINSYLKTDYDLSKYESVVNKLIELVKDVQNKKITVDKKNTIEATLKLDVKNLLGENISSFTSLLKDTTIKVPMSFTVANLEEDIEAIVLDLGKEGKLNKLSYVPNVAEALEEADGLTYVVLMKNIEFEGSTDSEINICQPTILNLNGFDILGTVNAGGHALRIVDSTLDSEAGMVYDVTGTNVRLAAGKYLHISEKEMNAMLQDTYVVNEDKYVTSKYYAVSEDSDGNITVELSSQFADLTEGNMQTLAADMISDLFFEFYNTASVSVDGKMIVSADAEDILGAVVTKDYAALAEQLKGCINLQNASEFASDLMSKFGNLDKIADCIEKGGEVASYKVTTANWGVKAQVLGEGDDSYLGLGLKTDNAVERQMTFKFADANPELAASIRELAEIFSVAYSFSYDGITITNGKIDLKGSAHVKVELDLENEDGSASDYITALGAILAYNEEDAAKREALVKAISYYENNIYAGYLKERIEEVSIGELIDALQKAGAEDVTFKAILEETGLRNLLTDTIRLEEKYRALLEIAYNLANTAETGIRYTEKLLAGTGHEKDIFGMKLGGTRDLTEDGYWCTYGGDFNYSENLTIDVRMKMFAGEYESPVDNVLKLLTQIPADADAIYHRCDENCPADCSKKCDNRELWLDVVAAAREAYDGLDDTLKGLIPEGLYNRLLAAEKLYNNMGVWVVDIEDQNYTGKAIKLTSDELRVYHGSTLLKEKTDYTVTYKYNTNAADAVESGAKAPRAVIKLKKNYTGTIYAYFTIKQIDLTKAYEDAEYREEVGLKIEDVYTASTTNKKSTNVAKPTVYLNGKKISTSEYGLYYPANPELSKGEDVAAYKVTGEYPITVTGKDKNFTGTYTVSQHVADKKMSSVSVKLLDADGKKATSFAYTGTEINPTMEVTIKVGKTTYTLVEGVHFTVERTNNKEAGTATFILTGTGKADNSENAANPFSFYGTKKVTFKITAAKDISSKKYAVITMLDNGEALGKGKAVTKTYTGSGIELEAGVDYKVMAADGVTELKLNTDYAVSYKKNTNAGTATIVFKGIGAYKGTVSKTFKIAKAVLDKDTMLVTSENIVVTYASGSTKPASEIKLQYVNPVTGEVKTLKSGTDYTLSFSNATKVATEVDENGKYVYPETLALKKQPTVKITGKGNFSGNFSLNYKIVPDDITITAKDVKYANKNNNYKTTVSVLSALNGKKVSNSATFTYYVWDAAKEEYVDIAANMADLISAGRFDSKGKKVQFIGDETEVQMKVVATGTKNYVGGEASAEYRIYKTSISSVKVTINQKFEYNKYNQSIDAANISVTYGKGKNAQTLTYGVDYKITETSYKNNLFAGTASVTLEGIGNFGGTCTKKFIISKFKQNANSISLGNEDGVTLYLNGTEATAENINTLISVAYEKGGVKPEELIKLVYVNPETGRSMNLVYGRDYTLTWSNTAKVVNDDGTYAKVSSMPKVKIKGIGNFKDTLTVYYTITKSNLYNEGIAITAKDVKYANKNNNYKTTVTVKDVNGKTLTAGTDYSKSYRYCIWVEDEVKPGYYEIESQLGTDFVTANGKVQLEEGQSVKMMVVVEGIKNYAGGEVSAEYILYRPAK